MFKDNLSQLRRLKRLTQEDVAERVGVVTVGDKGQVVIPAKARKTFAIAPGDQLVVLGDESQGLALIRTEHFLHMADLIRNSIER